MIERAYAQLASARQLTPRGGFAPGPVTPLLAKGGGFTLVHGGELDGGQAGAIGRYAYAGFTYHAVYTELPASTPLVPRLLVERQGRITDTTHYGFEIRNSRLWTESIELNERYEVTVSPFQDANWLLQLFSPAFVDYLGREPPADFSFELAYGSLLCSIEEDDPDPAELTALWDAAGAVARRIDEESTE